MRLSIVDSTLVREKRFLNQLQVVANSYEEFREREQDFVITGPMLITTTQEIDHKFQVIGRLESATPPEAIEVIVNGKLARIIDAQPERTGEDGFRARFNVALPLEGSSWVAVRAFTKRPNGRIRFAHTAPVHVKVEGKPLLPTRPQRDYLAKRVIDELQRNRGVISAETIREYEMALRRFEAMPITD